MFKKVSFVIALVGSLVLPICAQRVPSGISQRNINVLQRCGSATNVVFTNLAGQNQRKYNSGTGYFVDGSNFFNQVLGFGFTPSSSVTFADVIAPFGVYTLTGGQDNPGVLNVYIESDAG